MDAQWIVSANAGRARFYAQANNAAPLQEIEDFVNEAVRLRTVDTETDDLGQRGLNGTAGGTQPSGYEPHQTPAEHQTERFARDIAAHLARGHREHRYRELVLVASPEFLGVLRKQLDRQVASVIRTSISKDWSHDDPTRLLERIRAH